MTDLIICASSGKGTIAHVRKVIEGEKWERVYIITTPEFREEAKSLGNAEIITIDNTKMLSEMIKDMQAQLKDKVRIETAVNIISGEGKEYMALLSALLRLGVGIRFVAFTKEGIREI